MTLGTDQTVARVYDHLHGGNLARVWNLPGWPSEPTQRGIREYGPLPGRHADSPQRIQFVRRHISAYARDLALWELAGTLDDEHSAAEQIVHAAVGIAEQCGLPWLDGIAAGQAEMAEATTYARDFVDQLRRVVFPMARDRRPGDAILAAAKHVNQRHGCHMPSEELRQACSVIARSATSPARRRR
jgi:hypothetical protein